METSEQNLQEPNPQQSPITEKEPKGFKSLAETIPAIQDQKKEASCEIHGQYLEEQMYIGSKLMLKTSCPKCLELKEEADLTVEKAAQLKKLERQKQQRISDRLRGANIPDRFEEANFDNYKTPLITQARILKHCKNFAENFVPGKSMLLCGETGTGKTHLATTIMKTIIQQHDLSAVYIRAAKLLREIKSTYNRNSELTEDQVISRYTQPDLLVIDEIGVQYGTDAEKIILFEVLNERYEKVKSTILISNMQPDGVEEFAGKRLVDRMKEGGGSVIIFDWKSERK